jgi:hypothetical protein
MIKSKYQLTDDAIDSIVFNLSEFLEDNFLGKEYFESNEKYDKLSDEVFKLLEDFSNGYKNYN